MILFLCAQDLHLFWLGLIQEKTMVNLESLAISPETYLSEVDHFLRKVQIKPEQLAGVCVVVGPGSFTSSRISLTIANTLHFVFQIPLFVLTNPDHLPPQELIALQGCGKQVSNDEYATPAYDRPPHITMPRGDKMLDSR